MRGRGAGRDGTSPRPEAPPGAPVWICPPLQAPVALAGTRWEPGGIWGGKHLYGETSV